MAFAEKRHPAYDHLDAKKRAEGRHMTQAGDPIKGAKAMYELATMKEPPLRVVLGSDAYKVRLLSLVSLGPKCETVLTRHRPSRARSRNTRKTTRNTRSCLTAPMSTMNAITL